MAEIDTLLPLPMEAHLLMQGKVKLPLAMQE